MNMMDDLYRIYEEDVEFLSNVGFDMSSFNNKPPLPAWRELRVGAIERDESKIELFVEMGPAKFWTARITTCEGIEVEIITGSGSIQAYWPSILLIAKGMLSVKKL
jgi:hypothetical protein